MCRERAAQLRGRDQELAAAGARVVFVGNGTAAMAKDFAAQHAGAHEVLSDPSRQAFAAAGMRRSVGATLHWRLLRNAVRAFRRGFRQTKVQGDPWQQGGVLVFAGDGRLAYEQQDRVGGDELDLDSVVAAVRAIGRAAGGAS